jgi:hypothetical protein
MGNYYSKRPHQLKCANCGRIIQDCICPGSQTPHKPVERKIAPPGWYIEDPNGEYELFCNGAMRRFSLNKNGNVKVEKETYPEKRLILPGDAEREPDYTDQRNLG